MPGIFISYRRIDTQGWAGHLFADLRKSFGASQVFMDIQEGGIPPGTRYEQELKGALEECSALLALIGPQWISCTRADGTRRLDIPDDWVRKEVSAALRRNIPVVPVLLGGAPRPRREELPEDLHALCDWQQAQVTDDRWNYDVDKLIKELSKLTQLRLQDDVISANTGLRLLKDLIAERQEVGDAVSRSQEVIESTYLQIGKLVLFKLIHDALHVIELECLRPIQAGGAARRVRPFKIRFSGEAHRIQEAVRETGWKGTLRDDLMDLLGSAGTALEAAVAAPSEAACGSAVGELDELLSSMPRQFDQRISEAAAELNLDRLLELMTRVRDSLHTPASGKDPELEPFIQGIDALGRLRDELDLRVTEHGRLQRLDSKLRAVCVGGVLPGGLAGDWTRIKSLRSRLAPPFTPELEREIGDLADIERDIEKALEQGDEAAALDLVQEYFRAVSSVFRDVDGCLKDFCSRLSAVAQPLKTVLSMF